GFLANEYLSADRKQVVVAFRGTDTSNPLTLVKNIAADVSFVGSIPSPLLVAEVADAANFVKTVEQDNPNANITLTGHSLGGALAQLVGDASGLDTYAFDSPGGKQLYSSLSNSLSVGTWGTPVAGQVNTNYRLYGDQVSLAGTPIGNTVTIVNPNQPTLLSVMDLQYIGGAHNLENLISQIQSAGTDINKVISPTPPGQSPELDVIKPLQDMLWGTKQGRGVFGFVFFVSNGLAQLNDIDPTGGTDFSFIENPGSPNLALITLPILDGVASYQLRYSQNGVWSGYQLVQPGVTDNLPSGVSGVEFNAIGSLGQGEPLPSFLFQCSFSSTGTVSATLTETTVPSVWASRISGNWSNSSNWSGGVPNADSAVAVISASTTAALTVTLDAPQTVGTLVLGSGNPGVGYTLSGSGSNTLTFSNINNNAPAQILVIDGTHAINAPVILASNLVVTSTSSSPWTLRFGTASSITDNGNDLSLTMSASNGTLILSGSGNYTGGTLMTAGTLVATNSNAFPSGTSLTVGAGGTFIFDPSMTSSVAVSSGAAAVPEPSTLALLGVGVIGLLGCAWRRRFAETKG
ncbi:MAG: PEP-CTERM sorting domain-containing protein, partial [Thermoguttaceae bacterium]